ncbi:MAG: tetratricopeptide repeat protein [Candidatus Falkowbacteria bacterium]|nr:tetratricopeptide repeat protein [Candidatus Falkowbacteria bacterium]
MAGNIYFFLLVAILISLNASAKSAAGNQIIDIWPRLSVALSKLHLSKKYKLTIGKIDTANKSVNEKRAEIKILLALAVVLIMAWQIVAQLKILIADHYFNALYYNLGDRKYFTAYTLANYIINVGTSPNNQVYYDRFLADKISDFWPEISELSVRQPGALKLAQILGDLPDQGYENLLVKAKIDSTLRNFSAAEDYLVRAEKIGPNLPQTYFEAAQISLNKSDLNAAKDNYQLAFSKLPDFNDPLMNNSHRQVALRYRYILEKDLGDIYWQKKDYAAAERYYQKSYLSNPADFTLYKKIADTYYARREYDKAIYYNKLGFRRNPNDYAWPLSISLVYKEAGDKVKALESLNQAIKLAPTNDVLEKMRLEYVK